ncbi:MAG TPA: Hsp20/alpha crystallin family protein [Candidatus Tectomicrobia bacterium]|nr:Hsp20/alpha crystallin family protein [Candidatus Tectomicrobia bacterium]
MAERRSERESQQQVPMRRGEAQGGGALAPQGGPLSMIDWMFDRFQRDFFRDVFDEPFFGRALQRFGRGGDRMPRMEVQETDKELIVSAEMPGIDPKDIQIECHENVLTVSGERREEQQQGEQGMSRSYTRFFRQISLPPDVDLDRASASTRNGLLTIRLPRVEESRNVRRIPIDRGEGGQREQAA